LLFIDVFFHSSQVVEAYDDDGNEEDALGEDEE